MCRHVERAAGRFIPSSLVTLLAVGALAGTAWGQAVQELRVSWDVVGAPATTERSLAPGPPPSPFTLLGRQRANGPLPRQRNPELSAEQIVVVAEDVQGQAIDWQLMSDPRILRSEGSQTNGELAGQVLQHSSTELLITIPDDPAIVRLQFYHPRWNGSEFALDPLGTIPVR
jgi:hypothetical protein